MIFPFIDKKVILSVFFGAFVAVLLLGGDSLNVGIALAFCLIPLFLQKPYLYLFLFILLRPIVDLWSNMKIGTLNIAGIFTLTLIPILGIYLFLNKKHLQHMFSIGFLRFFNAAFAIFIIASLPSLMHSGDLQTSVADLMRLLAIWISVNATAIYVYENSEGQRRIVKTILLSSLIPVCFGIYQTVTGAGMEADGFRRVYGVFLHPNVFAEYLFMTFFILVVTISSYPQGDFRKYWLSLYFSLILVTIYFTYTRNVWASLVIALPVYALLRSHLSVKIKSMLIFMVAGVLLFPVILTRTQDLFDIAGDGNSWEWRLNLWADTIGGLENHPWIGNGLGMYERNLEVMAHNDYLRFAYEIGFVGLAAYLLVLGGIVLFALKRVYAEQTETKMRQCKAVVCISLGILMISFVDNVMRSTLVMNYYFIIVSAFLTVSTPNLQTRSSEVAACDWRDS